MQRGWGMNISRFSERGAAGSRVAILVAAIMAMGVGVAPPAFAAATASVGDATGTEGNSGSTMATFTVTIADPNATSTTVTYETYGISATPGSDFTQTAGTLTFAGGETSKTISVPVLGDVLDEADETF